MLTRSFGDLISILREAGCDEDIIRHSIAVYGVATLLATRLLVRGVKLDLDLIQMGALLHDIGRSRTHSPRHGYQGAELLKARGLDDKVILIAERHVGGGIEKEEAERLGMPIREYVPKSIEEKLVCYADKLVALGRLVSFQETLKTFKRKLGVRHSAIRMLENLHSEMMRLLDKEASILGWGKISKS